MINYTKVFQLVIITITSVLFNFFFLENQFIMMVFNYLQLFILIYYLIRTDYLTFFLLNLLFLAFSYEFAEYTKFELIFGYKQFELIGMTVSNYLIIALTILILFRGIVNMYVSTFIYKVRNFLFLLLLISSISTFFVFMLNHNNILFKYSVLRLIFENFYLLMFIPLTYSFILYQFTKENIRSTINHIYLFTFLIFTGLNLYPFLSLFFGKFGSYSVLDTLLVPVPYLILPFGVLLPFYFKFWRKWAIALSFASFVNSILLLFYNSTGKFIIIFTLVFLFLLIKIFVSYPKLILFSLGLVSLSFVLFFDKFMSSIILFSKMDDVISLLNIFDKDWFLNLPPSPKIRIIEIILIHSENSSNPIFFFFGKGFLASFIDNNNLMLSNFTLDSFSNLEWELLTFIRPHESFNLIYFHFGFFGLLLFFSILFYLVKKIHKSFFSFVGLLWFLLFFGYSLTLSSIGYFFFFSSFIHNEKL